MVFYKNPNILPYKLFCNDIHIDPLDDFVNINYESWVIMNQE